MRDKKSKAAFARAKKYIAGGVDSPVRAFGSRVLSRAAKAQK